MLDLGDEEEELALFADGERVGDHVTFAGVERGQELVEDRLGSWGDVHEEFAPVVGVGHALYEPAPFEGVEDRCRGAGGDEDALRDHRWLQRMTGAFDDGEDLARARRELVLLTRLPVVQIDEQIGGVVHVDEAFGGERVRAGVFVFEVVPDPSLGFGNG
jgi:hypothetical protein